MNIQGNGGSTPSQYALVGVETIAHLAEYLGLSEDLVTILECVTHRKVGEGYKYDDVTQVQDIIEQEEMCFSRGNILKAICRLGKKNSNLYEYNKIKFFTDRLICWELKNNSSKIQHIPNYTKIITVIDKLIKEELNGRSTESK